MPNEDRTYEVRHNRGILWDSQVVDGFTLSNEFSFSHSRAYKPNPAITFSHLDGLLITSNQSHSLDELFRVEHRFRSLVNLLGDCQLENAILKCNDVAAGGPNDVECYDARMTSGFSEREDARRGIIPVPYSEIAADFNVILQRWFELYDQLGPVVSLYLFGKHNRYLDTGNIFLGLMQGLERYHRSFHGGFFMSQAEYELAVRPALNTAIPHIVQDAFRQRLRSAI